MHSSFAIAALAAVAYAAPRPQGVTEDISPKADAPKGCSESYTGKFQIAAVNTTSVSKRDLEAVSTLLSLLLQCTDKNTASIKLWS